MRGGKAARSPILSILIADHHEVVRYGLRKILEQQSGWGVIAEAGEATRHIRAGLPNTEVLLFTIREDAKSFRKA